MLDDAVALHRAGRLEEAARAYEAVLAEHPDQADAWQLLGLVRHNVGASAQALAAFEQALALEPDHAPAWANQGLVMQALGRIDEAAASFRQAAQHRPGFREPLLNLARLEARRGDLPAALSAAEQALASAPDHPETLRMVGLLRAQTGHLDAAVAAWSHALDQAADPGLAMALGQALLQLGRPAEAVSPLATALRAGAPAFALFADAVLQCPALPDGLDDVLALAMARDDLDHQRLERALHQRLASLDEESLLAHPLLVPWLERCLVQHPDDLRRLEALRRQLIDQAAAGASISLQLAAALAVQAFLTEHAAPIGSEEESLVDSLSDADTAFALGAILRPLPIDTPRPSHPHLQRLWAIAVDNVQREAALAPGIESLGLGDDAVSADVRAMYEANPYPRRVGVHRPQPVPLDATLRSVGLRAPPRRPLQVLVAGAGTGQHPLQTATRYADVDVLGVNLSRASLARATRVAADHGITNVRFAQADLLELGHLTQRFDVIESVGVLHHLADPLAGWRVLRGLLADDGVMRIGLYAERGRSDVVAARQLVAEWGLDGSPAGLREARTRLLALPEEHPARPVVRSPDFPSLSGLRDLVFHVCEHRYTLERLGAELAALGLMFAGFQHTLPEAAMRYRQAWPEDELQRDLGRWEELEREHVRLFSGMYVFWCAPV